MTTVRECHCCRKPFNAGMKHCPHCGASRNTTEPGKPLDCPVCRSRLETVTYRNEEVDLCPKCKGMWLSNGEAAKLTSERDTFLDESIPHGYERPPLESRSAYVPCPECGKPMVRQNFRRISGVIVDTCGDHGTWFDAEELEQIRRFVANSGITQSQDREIEKNRIDIDGLKWRVSDLELMEKILHKWDPRRWRFRKL